MKALWILLAAGALATAWQAPASAFGRQFNERWCLANNFAFGGTPDCAYRTYRECKAMQSGVGGFCNENPAWTMARGRRHAVPDWFDRAGRR